MLQVKCGEEKKKCKKKLTDDDTEVALINGDSKESATPLERLKRGKSSAQIRREPEKDQVPVQNFQSQNF